ADVHPIGTTAKIVEIERLPEGRMNLVALGVDRFRLIERLDEQPYSVGRVQLLPGVEDSPVSGLAERVAQQFRRYLIGKGVPSEQAKSLALPDEASALSYLVAATLKAPTRQRQLLLEEDSLNARLRRELAIMEWELGGPAEPNARSF